MTAAPANLRLHFEQRNGTLRTAAQVAFGADGSLYLFPYAIGGRYWYGAATLPARQGALEVKFREQVSPAARPKLSVHWTGDVHIYGMTRQRRVRCTSRRWRSCAANTSRPSSSTT